MREVDPMDPSTPITLVAAGYSTVAGAIEDHDAVWAAREEGAFHHRSLAVLIQRDDGSFRVERENTTAGSITWGDALLDGALFVLLPRVSLRMLPTTDVDGRGAIIRHFYRHIDLDDLVAAAGLLDDSPVGLVVVVVNRTSTDVTRRLAHAECTQAVDTLWGGLEEELCRDLVIQVRAAPRYDYVDDVLMNAWRAVSPR
jgi:hypothetical protein